MTCVDFLRGKSFDQMTCVPSVPWSKHQNIVPRSSMEEWGSLRRADIQIPMDSEWSDGIDDSHSLRENNKTTHVAWPFHKYFTYGSVWRHAIPNSIGQWPCFLSRLSFGSIPNFQTNPNIITSYVADLIIPLISLIPWNIDVICIPLSPY